MPRGRWDPDWWGAPGSRSRSLRGPSGGGEPVPDQPSLPKPRSSAAVSPIQAVAGDARRGGGVEVTARTHGCAGGPGGDRATQGEGRRRPRTRAGPGAGRAGRGGARTDSHADRQTNGRSGPSPPWSRSSLRPQPLSTPRSSSSSPPPPPPWRHKGEGASLARVAAGPAPNGCPWLRRAPCTGGGVRGWGQTRRRSSLVPTLALDETPPTWRLFIGFVLGPIPGSVFLGPAP